jgi:hypothetical protein
MPCCSYTKLDLIAHGGGTVAFGGMDLLLPIYSMSDVIFPISVSFSPFFFLYEN